MARTGEPVALAPEALAAMAEGRAVVEALAAAERPVYGISTAGAIVGTLR